VKRYAVFGADRADSKIVARQYQQAKHLGAIVKRASAAVTQAIVSKPHSMTRGISALLMGAKKARPSFENKLRKRGYVHSVAIFIRCDAPTVAHDELP